VTWLIHMWHDSVICDITLKIVLCSWHDSFICDMTHSYVTCLIHMWHDSKESHLFVTWLSPDALWLFMTWLRTDDYSRHAYISSVAPLDACIEHITCMIWILRYNRLMYCLGVLMLLVMWHNLMPHTRDMIYRHIYTYNSFIYIHIYT